jgi:hypothetical protein
MMIASIQGNSQGNAPSNAQASSYSAYSALAGAGSAFPLHTDVSSQDWSNVMTYAGTQTPRAGADTLTLSDTARQMPQEGEQSGLAINYGGISHAAVAGVPIDGNSPHYVKPVNTPDGEVALQLGDVDASKSYFHRQGDNDLDYQGDCGLTAIGDVANQFGLDISENYVVHYATDNQLCATDGTPAQRGGTTMLDQEKVLDGLGIPSHIEQGDSLEGLGRELEEGHGVIIEVNAGALWDNPSYDDGGKINHAVTVTGVAADPVTGEAKGMWIDDSGANQYHRYVAADNPAVQIWLNDDSPTVVTDVEHA